MPIHEIYATASINEATGESDVFISPNERRIHHQGVPSWIWHDLGVICSAPTDLLLRPAHEVWYRWHYCIYFHHPSVLTQLVSWFYYKDHTRLMVLPILVSAMPSLVLLIVVDIIHFWLWGRRRQLLLLQRRLLPRLLLDHRSRLRRQPLGVGSRQLSRRRPKLLLLNWWHWPKAISFSCSAYPIALPSCVPRGGCSRPSVECTWLIQHCLIVPS